jgi:hypothetical protein
MVFAMTALSRLQHQFLDGIYHPSTTTPFLNSIQVNPRVSRETQFDIYRNSIIGRLQKALKAIYPVCYYLVGHDFFMHLASCYIEVTPSYSPDLNTYGENLSDFIRPFPNTECLPYLADVASLEWAWHRLYGAPDSSAFDFQKLANLYATAGEDIVFLLPPRTTLLTSPYPVHRIWEVNQPNYTDDTTIILETDQTYAIFIWQQQHVFHIHLIAPVEWQILSWFQQGLSFGQVCERAGELFPDLNMAELLPEFVKKGWLADVAVGTTIIPSPTSRTKKNRNTGS